MSATAKSLNVHDNGICPVPLSINVCKKLPEKGKREQII